MTTYDFLSAKQLLTELVHIIITSDFLSAKPAILSNVQTEFNWT